MASLDHKKCEKRGTRNLSQPVLFTRHTHLAIQSASKRTAAYQGETDAVYSLYWRKGKIAMVIRVDENGKTLAKEENLIDNRRLKTQTQFSGCLKWVSIIK